MDKGIYKITNLKNNKVYIGQSENLNNREWNHFYWLDRGEHHNEHLQKSYNKYGKGNFIFETLEELIGSEKAKLTKEKMSRSQKGRKHPEEVKEKIRQAAIVDFPDPDSPVNHITGRGVFLV